MLEFSEGFGIPRPRVAHHLRRYGCHMLRLFVILHVLLDSAQNFFSSFDIYFGISDFVLSRGFRNFALGCSIFMQ